MNKFVKKLMNIVKKAVIGIAAFCITKKTANKLAESGIKENMKDVVKNFQECEEDGEMNLKEKVIKVIQPIEKMAIHIICTAFVEILRFPTLIMAAEFDALFAVYRLYFISGNKKEKVEEA